MPDEATVHDQAEAAIEGLGGLDAAISGAETPAIETTPQESVTAPEAPDHTRPRWADLQRDPQGRWVRPQTPEQAQDMQQGKFPEQPQVVQDTESFMGQNFDPNNLSPELQQAYRQMQGHFTKRTQDLSALEKELQQYGDPSEIQKAMEIRNTLSDPANYVQLHQELTEYLQSIGHTPQQAQAVAAETLETQAKPPELEGFGQIDDPDLEPFKRHIADLKQELTSVKDEFTSWRQQREAQEMELALVGEVQRQVNAIRQARPDFTDGDIDAIFELGTYYEGDLTKSMQRYDEIFSDRMSRYLNSKQVAPEATGAFGGAGVTSGTPSNVTNLDEARAAALAFAAELDGQR